MTLYKVQAPDGSIISVEGPEGASPAEVIAQAQALTSGGGGGAPGPDGGDTAAMPEATDHLTPGGVGGPLLNNPIVSGAGKQVWETLRGAMELAGNTFSPTGTQHGYLDTLLPKEKLAANGPGETAGKLLTQVGESALMPAARGKWAMKALQEALNAIGLTSLNKGGDVTLGDLATAGAAGAGGSVLGSTLDPTGRGIRKLAEGRMYHALEPGSAGSRTAAQAKELAPELLDRGYWGGAERMLAKAKEWSRKANAELERAYRGLGPDATVGESTILRKIGAERAKTGQVRGTGGKLDPVTGDITQPVDAVAARPYVRRLDQNANMIDASAADAALGGAPTGEIPIRTARDLKQKFSTGPYGKGNPVLDADLSARAADKTASDAVRRAESIRHPSLRAPLRESHLGAMAKESIGRLGSSASEPSLSASPYVMAARNLLRFTRARTLSAQLLDELGLAAKNAGSAAPAIGRAAGSTLIGSGEGSAGGGEVTTAPAPAPSPSTSPSSSPAPESAAPSDLGTAVDVLRGTASGDIAGAIKRAIAAKRFADARELARKYNRENPDEPGISVDKIIRQSKQNGVQP